MFSAAHISDLVNTKELLICVFDQQWSKSSNHTHNLADTLSHAMRRHKSDGIDAVRILAVDFTAPVYVEKTSAFKRVVLTV